MFKSNYLLAFAIILALGGLLASEARCQAICGDANGDETVNVSDAVAIINYVFAGGEPPDPLLAGDCNCDATCNVADAVWVINYIFAGGYGPCDTNGDEIQDCDPNLELPVDIDGNVYPIVKIGDQWWFARNLKVTHYRNGDPIPHVTDDNEWTGLSTGAYCNYDNDPANVATYGRLYNWFVVEDSRGIAPEGWRIPTDEEWEQLETYLGENAGGKLKETGTAHWLSPNTGATNETGFTALPGGFRNYNGDYEYLRWKCRFWSSTLGGPYNGPIMRQLYWNSSGISDAADIKPKGYSIRCIKGEDFSAPEVTTILAGDITQTSAECGGEVTSDGGSPIIERGVCWSSGPDPSLDDSVIIEGSGLGSFSCSIEYLVPNTTYYYRAYATNSVYTGYGAEESFTTLEIETGTVTDIDGNVYTTVKIGDQWWMAENLKVMHYNNGDSIPNITADWWDLTYGAWCEFDNDPALGDVYGKLYNWYAVDDSRGIAPAGWHVSDPSEWDILEDFLGSSNAGGKLKETGTTHWNSPNTGATNETGFTALPGGYRGQWGVFDYLGGKAIFCTSYGGINYSGGSPIDSFVYRRSLGSGSGEIGGWYEPYNWECGRSIRCIKDTVPVVATANWVVSIADSTAKCNGIMQTNSGQPVLDMGVCWSTSPNPTIADATESGIIDSTWDVRDFYSCYLTDLTPNTTYYARAYATNSLGTGYGEEREFTTCELFGTVTDYDGNVYETVKIGDQWWMRTNLKVTHYRNGDPIPHVTDNGAWEVLSTGAYCELENDPSNVDTYGRLYNWYAVEDSRNIAPVGWHVPTDEEWKQMEMELGMSQAEADDTLCRATYFLIDYENQIFYGQGSMLKEFGTTHWDCYPEKNQDALDLVGFTVLEGGEREYMGIYGLNEGYFWTATMYSGDKAWQRIFVCNQGCVARWSKDKRMGMSIRCVKD